MIPENTATFFTDPYFASVIQGAAMRVSETDFTLALLIAAGSEDKTRRYLRAGNVDGALVLSHHTDDRSYAHLAGALPLVFGGRPMSAEGSLPCYVDVDNVAAATTVTRRLVDAGRRRIATSRARTTWARASTASQGWRQALAEAGQPDDLVERGDFSPASGAAAARRLLARGEPFDGLFVASAQMASGALTVLREHGLAVPRDLGLVDRGRRLLRADRRAAADHRAPADAGGRSDHGRRADRPRAGPARRARHHPADRGGAARLGVSTGAARASV